MPKQFLKLNDFRGGLNLIQDPRDIAMNELAQADNANLKRAGRLMTANLARGTDGNSGSIPDIYVYPGGGIFPFETDREGSAAAKDIGETWVAALNSITGEVSLKGRNAAEAVVVDMGTPTSFSFLTNTLSFLTSGIQDIGTVDQGFKDKFKQNDVLRITGCTDVTANNRVVRITGLTAGGQLLFINGQLTSESSEAGVVT